MKPFYKITHTSFIAKSETAVLKILLFCIFFDKSSYIYAQQQYDPMEAFLRKEKKQQQINQLNQPISNFKKIPKNLDQNLPFKKKSFYIEKFIINGNTLLSEKELRYLTSPYLFTEISFKDIEDICYKLTDKYIDKGYITTRVYLPNQNIKTSQSLTLNIFNGFIDNIVDRSQPTHKNFHENSFMNTLNKFKVWMCFPTGKGDLLNTRDLDQGMEHYNRVLSNQVQLFLLPGETEGSTQVLLKGKKEDLLRGTISYSNDGNVNTGKDQVSFKLKKDQLLGLNDSLSLYHISSEKSQGLALYYTLPFKNWLLTYSQSYSDYQSIINKDSDIEGRVQQSTFNIQRSLLRCHKKKLSLKMECDFKKSSRFYNDIDLLPQPLSILRCGLEYQYQRKKSSWFLDSNYSKGISYHSIKDPFDIDPYSPHAQFDKVDLALYSFIFFNKDVSFKGTLKGQYSFNSLYSSEQFFLGSSDSIRGLSDTLSVGDSGFYIQTEMSKSFFFTPLRFYIFSDLGMTTSYKNKNKSYLSSKGFGLRYNHKSLDLNLSYGFPSSKNRRMLDNDKNNLQATLSFKVF
ncbi:hypothetical protein AB834_02410 [PVC group bacterium (ex Bugula neritina AB1)]|nr:hypothetical protein AB834_02410 [PVC group bacterium (ex Bugula neritina AB1)]